MRKLTMLIAISTLAILVAPSGSQAVTTVNVQCDTDDGTEQVYVQAELGYYVAITDPTGWLGAVAAYAGGDDCNDTDFHVRARFVAVCEDGIEVTPLTGNECGEPTGPGPNAIFLL